MPWPSTRHFQPHDLMGVRSRLRIACVWRHLDVCSDQGLSYLVFSMVSHVSIVYAPDHCCAVVPGRAAAIVARLHRVWTYDARSGRFWGKSWLYTENPHGAVPAVKINTQNSPRRGCHGCGHKPTSVSCACVCGLLVSCGRPMCTQVHVRQPGVVLELAESRTSHSAAAG